MGTEKTSLENDNQPSCSCAVRGSYIWLVEDCDGRSILSAHLTEKDAKEKREKLRSGYAPRVDFRVYSVVIS